MKFCESHWEELKEGVKARGLWHLVSRNGEELAKRLTSEDKTWGFDPLMSAHNMILSNAIQSGGMYLLAADLCPLCELDAHREEMGEGSKEWITHACDGVLLHCREKGLVQIQ